MAVGSLDVGGSGSCGLKRDGELRGSSNDQLGLFILLQGYFCAGPRTMVTMVYIYIASWSMDDRPVHPVLFHENLLLVWLRP